MGALLASAKHRPYHDAAGTCCVGYRRPSRSLCSPRTMQNLTFTPIFPILLTFIMTTGTLSLCKIMTDNQSLVVPGGTEGMSRAMLIVCVVLRYQGCVPVYLMLLQTICRFSRSNVSSSFIVAMWKASCKTREEDALYGFGAR